MSVATVIPEGDRRSETPVCPHRNDWDMIPDRGFAASGMTIGKAVAGYVFAAVSSSSSL